MIKKPFFLNTLLLVSPFTLHAATEVKNLRDLANFVINVINAFVPILIGIAFLAFIWGVVVYLWSSNPQKLKEARNYLIFSIIGFTVMLSVWGLALMFKNLFFQKAHTPAELHPITPDGHSNGYIFNENDTPTEIFNNTDDVNVDPKDKRMELVI